MKFVKGVTVFLVLCLAVYGAFVLLKQPPKIDLNEADIAALNELGIYAANGQAAETGQSAIFGVEGAPPIGFMTGTSAGAASIGAVPFGGTSIDGGSGSSVPPSFLGGQVASSGETISFAPSFAESAPRVAAASDPLQSAPEFFAPSDTLLPPPVFSAPVELPPAGTPSQIPSIETSPLNAPPPFTAPAETVPIVSVPIVSVPATESPPMIEASWDGPAADISDMSAPDTNVFFAPPLEITPQENFQQPRSFSPISPPIARTQPPADNTSADTSVDNTPADGVTNGFDPLLVANSVNSVSSGNTDTVWVPAKYDSNAQEQTFSSVESVPLNPTVTSYSPTSARQPLTFEPVKPEHSANAPMVAFSPPKIAGTQQPQASNSTGMNSTEVKQIGTPRTSVNNGNVNSGIVNAAVPSVDAQLTAIHDTVVRFVQSQRQLAESDDPNKIRNAFVQLSQLYEHKQLGEAEKMMIQPILDSLALKVIYSRDTHILESAYRVKPGDTVESIAKSYNLSPALLRKINGITIPQEPPAGTTLKVVHGQFDARISLKRKELTLLLGGLYAGRFVFTTPIAEIPVRSGEFFVTHRTDQTLKLNNGWVLSAPREDKATIVFSAQDAREIFDILSEHSVIVLE